MSKVRTFEISVVVKYRAETVPEDMEYQLLKNLDRCIRDASLLDDVNRQAIIEQLCSHVEEIEENRHG